MLSVRRAAKYGNMAKHGVGRRISEAEEHMRVGLLYKLKRLMVFECSRLEELPSMETLLSLEMLWGRRMCKAAKHQGLAQCTKRPKLIVSKATKVWKYWYLWTCRQMDV